MVTADVAYWGLSGLEVILVFRAEIHAPARVSVGEEAWECMTLITVGGQTSQVLHRGQHSMQALQHAVGFVVAEERAFLLAHEGPIGLDPTDVSDDGGKFAETYAEALRRFDPLADKH